MDRETIMMLLTDLEDNTLAVRPDGAIVDSEWSVHDTDETEAALDELAALVDRFRKVIAWAKTAPEYEA